MITLDLVRLIDEQICKSINRHFLVLLHLDLYVDEHFYSKIDR